MSTYNPSIIYNAIKTPDGTVLESKHTHDYQTHTDKNGDTYMVDGGKDYLRRSGIGFEELSVSFDSPFGKVREYFTWGKSYSKDGCLLKETQYITLDNIEDDHLLALVLWTQKHRYPLNIREAFLKEVLWRSGYKKEYTNLKYDPKEGISCTEKSTEEQLYITIKAGENNED